MKLLDFISRQHWIIDTVIVLAFIVAFFVLCTCVKNKFKRYLLAFILAIFIVIQILSLYFTQSFLGYQFYIHINLRDVFGVKRLFINQVLFSLIALLTLVYFFVKAPVILEWLNKWAFKNSKFNWLPNKLQAIIGIVVFIIVQGDFITETKSLFTVFFTANDGNFETVLENNNMTSYIMPNEIKCEAKTNIIVISLESLEQGFLHAKHAHLTPNINALKNKWHYFNINPNFGSEWTSGSLYSSLTGFPALFGLHGNSIFNGAYFSNISSITHALKKANYTNTYIGGNADFSGTKHMLKVLQFDKIVDYKNTNFAGNLSSFGLRDKEVFSAAKTEIQKFKQSKEPFFLYIATTDTHFPNGIYDKRMEKVISQKQSTLEFTVASADYLLGDFISFLENNDILNNTKVYIFPDHLKMGKTTLFNNTGKRSLYCITNAKIDSTISHKKLYQIDLPKVILNGVKAKHNLKFLTDYIANSNKDEFIREHQNEITLINTNGILNYNTKRKEVKKISKNLAQYKKDTLRFIAHAGGQIDGKRYTNCLEALNANYKKGFRLFELDIIKTKDEYYVAAHDWSHWAKITNYKGELPPSLKTFLSNKIYDVYTPLDFEAINTWFKTHKDAILVTDKVDNPKAISKFFTDKNRLIMELFSEASLNQALSLGIHSAMPSQSLIKDLGIDDVAHLQKKGVKHIAISQRFINEHKDLLKSFLKHNIKPYAYHINFNKTIDELYMLKYEMDYVYGIYADNWQF